eukprot:267608_1
MKAPKQTTAETITLRLKDDNTSLDLSSFLKHINLEIRNIHEEIDQNDKETETFDFNTFQLQSNEIFKKYQLVPFPSKLLLNYSSSLTRLMLDSWPIISDYSNYPNWPPKDKNMTVSNLQNSITFPECIYDLTNLQYLELYHYPFPYLSSKLGQLTKLTKLNIGGCKCIKLPREIKHLQKLFKLNTYSGSHQLHYMPFEITLCSSLKESQMSTRALLNSDSCYLLFPP